MIESVDGVMEILYAIGIVDPLIPADGSEEGIENDVSIFDIQINVRECHPFCNLKIISSTV